ncbi:hypothetical protein [Polaromonas sp.]|uniref:hypothetical protein n=1 Tax=Polaromonas sp. TaxID=1869339 RepID=UPI0017CB721E|nr:hypothetical protein [Polaromonas sp.]NMM08355.1 hypothetical protein [Polaromonas sp.]
MACPFIDECALLKQCPVQAGMTLCRCHEADGAAAQVTQLIEAQAAGIGGHQEGARLDGHWRVQQGGHFGAREQLGQALRDSPQRDLDAALGLAQHVADQKPDGARGCVDGRASAVALLEQMQQVRLYLLIVQQRRAAAVVARQLLDGRHIGPLGAPGKAAQHHRIDHALAKRCHDKSL